MTKKEPEPVTAWITKYALTDGVYALTGAVAPECPSLLIVSAGGEAWCADHFHGLEWHRTEAEAIERAERMRETKIANLYKQIAKLEALDFSKEKQDA